jgi:type II secretory pathway pseudopilin PulG
MSKRTKDPQAPLGPEPTNGDTQALRRERDAAVATLNAVVSEYTRAVAVAERSAETAQRATEAAQRALEAARTWKGHAEHSQEGYDEALAGWRDALADVEFDETFDGLRGLFDDIAPRLFPWELAAFARLVSDTTARLAPHEVSAGGGRVAEESGDGAEAW